MFAQPYISANIILDISEPPIECTQLVAQNKSIFDWSSVTRTVEVVKNFRANGENFFMLNHVFMVNFSSGHTKQ